MKAKTFGILFLSTYFCFTAAVLGLAAWLEPFEGDLTRVGGISENHFGWQAPQASFPGNLSRYGSAPEDYDGNADVLVFGDSFSQMGNGDNRRFTWQNYLSAATGLRIYTHNVNLLDAKEWLRQREPDSLPKYVIFQRIERRMSEYKSERDDCEFSDSPVVDGDHKLIPAELATEAVRRPEKGFLELKAAVHWLKINLGAKRDALRLDLKVADLFSNAADDRILVYENDFLADKERRENTEADKLICYLADLRQLVEANGRSRFILAIAPDKYTAYQHVIADASAEDNLFTILERAGAKVVRFDSIFASKVSESVQDLYLPNDTHWGSEGNRLFASVLAQIIADMESRAREHFSRAP